MIYILILQALCLSHCPVSSSVSNGITANKANIIKCVSYSWWFFNNLVLAFMIIPYEKMNEKGCLRGMLIFLFYIYSATIKFVWLCIDCCNVPWTVGSYKASRSSSPRKCKLIHKYGIILTFRFFYIYEMLLSRFHVFCFMIVQQAMFLNVVSGLTLTETAGDLAIAAAICSRFMF